MSRRSLRVVRDRRRLGMLGRISAYHLQTNIYALLLLVLLGLVAVFMYFRSASTEGFAANLWLAFATSLMASILVLLSETFVKYRAHQNDVFLEGIAKLGISNLHFDKQSLLSELMDECSRTLWAVGYRCILTSNLADKVELAASRKVAIRLLIVPPWTDSFRLVYGEQEKVADNYLAILLAVLRGSGDQVASNIEVRFVDRPLFNDTYRVDDVVVTGPYMHNADSLYGKLSANDFFTYELHRASHLHGLISDEFEVLWQAAESQLDWTLFCRLADELPAMDLNDQQKLAKLRQASVPRTAVDRAELS